MRIDWRNVIASLFVLGVVACSSDSTESDRRNVPGGSQSDGGGSTTDAGVDPKGGRDSEPSSCFAACQNGLFACQQRTDGKIVVSKADVTLDSSGCSGTLTTGNEVVALKLTCLDAQVCFGGAPGTTPTNCVPGTFSAFSFAYAPEEGAPLNVCTRE